MLNYNGQGYCSMGSSVSCGFGLAVDNDSELEAVGLSLLENVKSCKLIKCTKILNCCFFKEVIPNNMFKVSLQLLAY